MTRASPNFIGRRIYKYVSSFGFYFVSLQNIGCLSERRKFTFSALAFHLRRTMTEFEFIDHIAKLFAPISTHGFEGIGDDCAVLPIGEEESLVFTADLLAENIHFLRHAASAYEIGRKSLAVNLSDVAAMGVSPIATLLSIALPNDLPKSWAKEFMEGYHALSEEFSVALIGGDTTRSDSGITINVTAIGRGPSANIKRRSDARSGDVIFVAGKLGASGRGLQDLLAGEYGTPQAITHNNPQPQVTEGIWLGAHREVHAMMDLSDGLASDLRHILQRSKVGAEIDTQLIPIAESSELRTALCGGEDYKLLFTVDPFATESLIKDFHAHFGTPIYPIGRITESGKLQWLDNGNPIEADWQGFMHF